MKKIFTLIAATLMAVGANAQTYITFDATGEKAAGEVSELTLGDNNFKVALVGGSKAKIDKKSLAFKTGADATAESFAYQWCPGGGVTKTSGERSITITVSKAGTLTIYPRSASSDDRPFTVEQGGSVILSDGMAYNGKAIADTYYKAYAVTVAAGTINVKCEAAVNFSGFKFEASADEPSEEPAGEAITWTFNNVATGSLTTEKVYQTLVGDLMFTGSANEQFNLLELAEPINGTFSDGTAWSASKYVNLPSNTGGWVNAFSTLRQAGADGAASNDTFRRALAYNATKKGTLYVAFGAASSDESKVFEIYASYNDGSANTYSTANAPFAVGPVEVKLSSTTDAATFWIRGSKNGTRIYAVRFVPEGATTAIETVKAAVKADGVMYNLAGQKVGAGFKGIAIKNGKKVVIK